MLCECLGLRTHSNKSQTTFFFFKKLFVELDPIVKAWFNEGKDNPNLTVIHVQPEYKYYWDTKSRKVVLLLKMGVGAVIRKPLEDGIEGKLSV